MKGNQQFQEAGEDRSLLALVHGTRARTRWTLVWSMQPIDNPAHQVRDQETGNGKFGIHRLHHSSIDGSTRRREPVPAADREQSGDRENQGCSRSATSPAPCPLQPRARSRPSWCRRRLKADSRSSPPSGSIRTAARTAATRPQVDRVLREHIDDQQVRREKGAQAPSEAPARETRNREDPAPQIQGREQGRQNDQAPRGHPLVIRRPPSDAVSVAGHPDDVLGGDVRSEAATFR